MKKIAFLASLLLMPLPALAQAAPDSLVTAGADIPAVFAKAKAEQKSPACALRLLMREERGKRMA